MSIKLKKPHTPNRLLYFIGYKGYFEKFVKKTLGVKINNQALTGLKPPFIVIANHVSTLDFCIAGATVYPNKCNFVGAVNNFIGKSWAIKQLGTLSKRQFTADLQLVRDIKHLVDKNATIMLFPEARMSADGRCSPIPTGIAKMVKLAGANLLCVNISGAYLCRPKWLNQRRAVPIVSNLSLIASKEELPNLSVGELHQKIETALQYDDYKYQRENKIVIDEKRCENLHTLLYRCPVCDSEYTTVSHDKYLECTHCGEVFNMDEYGVIHNDKLPFDSVTAWYDYEKEKISELVKSGEYYFEDDCDVEAIFDKPKYVCLGKGKIVHDYDGFTLTIGDKTEKFHSAHNFAIAYDTGKCIYLSTPTVSYKVSPINKPEQCTAISLAVEEIFANLPKIHKVSKES